MKPRHIIPWIPIIGFIVVLLWPSDLYEEEQAIKNYPFGFTDYMWGGPWSLAVSSAFQSIWFGTLLVKLL